MCDEIISSQTQLILRQLCFTGEFNNTSLTLTLNQVPKMMNCPEKPLQICLFMLYLYFLIGEPSMIVYHTIDGQNLWHCYSAAVDQDVERVEIIYSMESDQTLTDDERIPFAEMARQRTLSQVDTNNNTKCETKKLFGGGNWML